MQVRTPISDLEIVIDRLAVENGALVMTNSRSDALETRAILGPGDMRKILAALLRPSVIWFMVCCLFRSDVRGPGNGGPAQEHPTPNPW